MAIIPTHQNRHFFVMNAFSDGTEVSASPLTIASAEGTLQGKFLNKDRDSCDPSLYFVYKGKGESILTTDKIPLKNLNYVKLVKAWDMVTPMTIKVVTLDPTVNGGKPKVGEDYLIRIVLPQFHSNGADDIYVKDAVVRVTASMLSTINQANNNKAFYDAMADALNLSFSREVGATRNSNPYLKFEGSASCLTIWELPQAWAQGTQSVQRILFDVQPTTIFDGAVDVVWGKVTDRTYPKYVEGDNGLEPFSYNANREGDLKGIIVGYGRNATGTGNGRAIADLEWFCMGERGDQYRMMGYPNYIPTQYMVNPDQQYNVLELHFAFTDWGVDSYRSEKDITIVAPDTVNGKAAINGLVSFLNTNAGTELTALE